MLQNSPQEDPSCRTKRQHAIDHAESTLWGIKRRKVSVDSRRPGWNIAVAQSAVVDDGVEPHCVYGWIGKGSREHSEDKAR